MKTFGRCANGCAVEGADLDQVAANVRDRKRLLAAGWQPQVGSGLLLLWQRSDGRSGWYSQEVAVEILEALEDEASRDGEGR
jgi:hypothetical protein